MSTTFNESTVFMHQVAAHLPKQPSPPLSGAQLPEVVCSTAIGWLHFCTCVGCTLSWLLLPEAACRSTGCSAAAASGVASAKSADEGAAALAALLADFLDLRAFLRACLAPLVGPSAASSSCIFGRRGIH
jgi:hypothetical protein